MSFQQSFKSHEATGNVNNKLVVRWHAMALLSLSLLKLSSWMFAVHPDPTGMVGTPVARVVPQAGSGGHVCLRDPYSHHVFLPGAIPACVCLLHAGEWLIPSLVLDRSLSPFLRVLRGRGKSKVSCFQCQICLLSWSSATFVHTAVQICHFELSL